ncbi:MAG: M55 family metallopeptidase [Acidobacteria bacterium]|nr:M55 family metallopeptidase [Acidobacteriota bacterium]
MRKFALLMALLATTFAVHAQPQKKLKVYISVDMEGVVGAVTSDQLGPTGFEYARYREFMTRETLAAINAAKESGATEILVSDSHGNGENLLIEMFPSDVRIIRSWPRHLHMMAGIDESFDAVIFIGYHASTNNPRGVRAHTFSSARLTRVALNGKEVTEGAWAAAIAGHFKVPVVMMSGDDAAIEEVRSAIGPIEGAETKKTLGFHSANTLTPQASYDLIGKKVKAALGRVKDFKPYVVSGPVTVDISFKHYTQAEAACFLRAIERIDSHTVRFRARDMAEAADFIEFITTYGQDLQP